MPRIKKIIYILIAVGAVTGSITYFSGLYTYFIKIEVQESLPSSSATGERSTEIVRKGSFTEVDFIHKGSGQAKLIRIDESYTLRLEDFNVVNGPDLYVYLTKTDRPTGDIESLGDFIDLGRLKGTMGNQNYAVLDDVRGYRTAVVWCKRYGVLFTYAVME